MKLFFINIFLLLLPIGACSPKNVKTDSVSSVEALNTVDNKYIFGVPTTGHSCPNGAQVVKLKSAYVSGSHQVLLCGYKSNDTKSYSGKDAYRAVGPFNDAMIAKCKKLVGQSAAMSCENKEWTLSFAFGLRGNEICPFGTSLNPKYGLSSQGGVCVGKINNIAAAFGPFPETLVEECEKKTKDENVRQKCRQNTVLDLSRLPARKVVSATERLAEFYNQPTTGFTKVINRLFSWFGTTTNACVATIVTALNQIGVPGIPEKFIRTSTYTIDFANQLRKLGWKQINDYKKLVPGALVFVGPYSLPEHVMVFMKYGSSKDIAYVIDNQSAIASPQHQRNLIHHGNAFAFALIDPEHPSAQ